MNADDLPAEELVAIAMELLGAENAPQLADALGMTKRNQDKTVRRWIDGVNEPSYTHTLRLLSEVGLLPNKLPAREPGGAWTGASAGVATGEARGLDVERLEQALEELADLGDRQAAVLDELLGRGGEQEQQPRAAKGRRRAS